MDTQHQRVEYHDTIHLDMPAFQHTQTHQTLTISMQDFPLKEIKNHMHQMSLIGHLETSAFESAISGWTRFIAPFTPHCFTVSPSTAILDSVSGFLLVMSFHDLPPRFRLGHSIFAELHVKMLPLWPTIWTWLQILYNDKHMHSCASHGTPEINISSGRRQRRYEAMCSILRSFLYSDAQTALSATVLRTEGVMTMAAELWIEEARDKQAVFGFEMGKMLHIPAWTPEENADISLDFLNHIVTCGGGEAEVVKLLYHRIKTNLLQLEPEMRALVGDLTMAACWIHDNTGTPILRDTLLSNARYAMIFMVDTVSLILKAYMRDVKNWNPRPLDIVHLPLTVILSLMKSSRAYECISQILDTTFFTLVSQVSFAFKDKESNTFGNVLDALLQNISLFAAHRSLLKQMKRILDEASLSMRVSRAIAKFRFRLEAWLDIDEEIKDFGPCQIICGDPQCVAFDFKGKQLRRCSGCSFICYCSKICQKRHWRGEHKKYCHHMRHSSKGIVGLSGPNLRFLAHMILWDATLPVQRLKLYSRDDSPREGASTVRHSVVLDYNGEGPRVIEGTADFQNLSVTPTPSLSTFMSPIPPMAKKFSSRLPELKYVLQRHWAVSNDLPSAVEKRIFTPVLALVPRGGENIEEDSQVIAAMMVETQIPPGTGESIPRMTGRYVRWLYCI